MTVAPRTYAGAAEADAGGLLRRGLSLMTETDRRLAGWAFLTSLLAAATSALLIWSVVRFMQLLFDPAASEADAALIWFRGVAGDPGTYGMFLYVGAFCALTAVADFAVQLLQVRETSKFASGMTRDLGRRLLSIYLRQPYEFFIDRHRSDLSASILSEAEAAVSQVYRPALQLATSLPATLAVVAVLASVNVEVVAYLGGGITVVYGAIYFAVRHHIKRLGIRRAEANQRRFRAAGDGLQSIRDVKVLGLEDPYLERYDVSAREVRDVTIASQVFSFVPGFALRATLLVCGIVFLLLYVRPEEVMEGRALEGLAPALGALAVAAQRMLPELQRIMESALRLQYGAGALDRLHRDLTQLRAPAPAAEVERIRLTRELVFGSVSYSYPGASHAGVANLSLRIGAGERIGIVGRSGAGKTTLGDLTLGLLAPAEGRMVVDGTVITEPLRAAWRKSVGFVPQDIFMVDATVAENIALGVEAGHIDMTRVRESARIARIDGFVTEHLPQGYDTMVGERGVRLSGGQRQRLAIARALYRDADIIVLDEATSALDTRTEEDVMDALGTLPGTKTILVIAHRLSTLNLCDRIVVLENGTVAGVGTRAELERDCAAFRELLPKGGEGEEGVL